MYVSSIPHLNQRQYRASSSFQTKIFASDHTAVTVQYMYHVTTVRRPVVVGRFGRSFVCNGDAVQQQQ